MARLVIFCIFLAGLVGVMNLSDYKDLKVETKRFDMKAKVEEHKAHVKELAELAKMHAEAIAPPVQTEEALVEKTIIPLDTPQLVRADKLYKQCIACHGKAGEGKSANKAPKIGGQMAWYIDKQLSDMKAQIRVNKNMASIVKRLSAQDIADLSAYISKLPWK